ncbi:MAG TPA: hypothetical protein VES01_03120, partial [Dermatophilaceae bacterium]|nr:hypothetical protein [Dermatophilaceae bacterium]
MTGSTLYRRLPNGSWAAQREDPAFDDAEAAAHPAEVSPAMAAAAAVAAPGVGSSAGDAPGSPRQPTIARPTPPPTRRRKRWSIWRVLRWAVVAYVLWLGALVVYAGVSLEKVEALSPDPIADTDGTVWLLVGSDSRDGLSKKEQRELRTGNTEGQRTDTIMLVHQKLGQTPTLVSIPRDSWVTIPAHGA